MNSTACSFSSVGVGVSSEIVNAVNVFTKNCVDLDREHFKVFGNRFENPGHMVKTYIGLGYVSSDVISIKYSYLEGDASFLTEIGRRCFKFVGESDFSCKFSGEYDLTLGCPSIARHYIQKRSFYELSDSEIMAILNWGKRMLIAEYKKLHEAERKILSERKAYGQKINMELAELGLNNANIQHYWKMNWRKEISPIEFSNFVLKARNDKKSFQLALSAHSNAVLERLGWKVRPSYPRTMDLLEAIAKVVGVEKIEITDPFILEDSTPAGRWVFGE